MSKADKTQQYRKLWDIFEKNPRFLILMARHGVAVDLIELKKRAKIRGEDE